MSFLAATATTPYYKFAEVGASVAGRIVGLQERDKHKFQTAAQRAAKEPRVVDTWPNGETKKEMVVTLEQEPGDEDSRVLLVISSASQVKSTREALRAAGASDIREGDDLRQTWTGVEGIARQYTTVYSVN